MINQVIIGGVITLANIFGSAPFCTDNGASLSCFYYSAQTCLRTADQLGLLCVANPKRDIPGYTEPRRRGRK
jgi:hypothetical protein